MKRGQKTSAEQVVLKLRHIEVQTAQGKSLALACKEAEISEQSDGRVPTPRDLLLAQGGADRDWDLAEYLQPRSAALFLGLPAARACHLPGSGLPATHGRRHAVASQLARSKIPVRSPAMPACRDWSPTPTPRRPMCMKPFVPARSTKPCLR
jgi:putative transposase